MKNEESKMKNVGGDMSHEDNSFLTKFAGIGGLILVSVIVLGGIGMMIWLVWKFFFVW